MTNEPDDASLLAMSASGDPDAFDRFVARHRAAVFRYLRTKTNDADADDALQHTFVQAWRNAATIVVADTARPWLFTVARNAVVLQQRHAHATNPTDDEIGHLGELAGFAADDATPQRFAEVAEERSVVQAALASLPEQDREILTLRDLEQLPGERVAELLSLSLPAMKSRLHRARLRLVAELRNRMPEEENR
jgi:RNA polymerase sigma-70 factor (ECF subfamily)